MLGGVFAKNTSFENKFPSPLGSGNFSSLEWYFMQIPLPNMIYLLRIIYQGLSWHCIGLYKVGSIVNMPLLFENVLHFIKKEMHTEHNKLLIVHI